MQKNPSLAWIIAFSKTEVSCFSLCFPGMFELPFIEIMAPGIL